MSVVLFAGTAGCGRSDPPALPPAVPRTTATPTAFGLDGRPIDPFSEAGGKAVVLLFVSTDCPISNRYAPEVRRLTEQFEPGGIRFWLVYADPSTTPQLVRKHVEDFQYPLRAIRDPAHTLVKRAKVRVTPEAAVFAPNQELLYYGRIDDRYVDFGKERPAPTQRDLKDVLQAVLDGRSVTNSPAPAIGCYIPEPEA